MAETAQLNVRIDLEGNLSKGIQGAQRQLAGLNKSVGRVGKGIGQVGAGFARAGLWVGGAAVAGLTGAAKAAIDFEDAFAGVRKTVDEADLKEAGLSFEGLAKSFRDMATEIPISASEFARLGETAGALGIKAQDIQEFSRVTALMGVTTNLSADEAADAFGRIGTILNLTGDDYQELADSIVSLGNAGASTESEITEITKRFATQAKQLGLAKEEMVALASATASLGFAPERGGTALARVFADMSTNIATANDEGKALSSGLGRSIKDLRKDIDKGKGLDIFMDVLETIKGMSTTETARFLKSIGVTNTSDRNIFTAMSQQLPFVNEQLDLAKKSQGALLKEAEQRFATTASKIQLFKNNIIEAGIAVGEQMLPAVGRALDKVIGALKDPGTKSDLVQLGKDIGQAIDDIDWAAVVKGARDFAGVMKSALGFVMTILEAINKLPGEVKAAGAAFLVLNKASGGLIASGAGNIVSGLGETVARSAGSKLPGVGKLFAQPVYVVNFPPGFGLGGIGGAAAGAGAIGAGVAGGAIAAAVAATAIGLIPFIERNNRQGAAGLNKAEIAAVNYYAADKTQQQQIFKRLGYVPSKADADSGNAKLDGKLSALQSMAARTKDDTVAAQDRTRDATMETKRETGRGLALVRSTQQMGTAAIVSALWATRTPAPMISMNISGTSMTKTASVATRYGKVGTSRTSSNGSTRTLL